MSGRIIFLCTGNICRSPLAEVLAAEKFAGRGVSCGSAGLDATIGLPASCSSGQYAASVGLELGGHHSQPIGPQLLAASSWMIGMTRSQAAIFRSRYGHAYQGKVGILGAPGVDLAQGGPSPEVEEVDDPYGMPSECYFDCGDQISRLLQGWTPVFEALKQAR